MKILRRFIVRQFALYRMYIIFGRKITVLRASRMFVATMILAMILFSLDGSFKNGFNWWDYIWFVLFFIEVWIGFGWFGIGYFEIWPVKWEELDGYQKVCYCIYHGYVKLTDEHMKEINQIKIEHPKWF